MRQRKRHPTAMEGLLLKHRFKHTRVWVIWILSSDSAGLVQFDTNVCMQLDSHVSGQTCVFSPQSDAVLTKPWSAAADSRCI